MEEMSSAEKKELYKLVEALPSSEVPGAVAYLSARLEGDPVQRAFDNAPYDDEPITPEEEEAIAKARAELDRGEGISDADLRRDLGL